MHPPGAAGRLFQGLFDLGVEPGQRLVESRLRHEGGGHVHAVETGRVLAYRLGAAPPDVIADGPDPRHGGLDIDGGPGQDRRQGGPAELGWFALAQVDTGNHPPSLRSVAPPTSPSLYICCVSACRAGPGWPARRAPLSATRIATEVSKGQNAIALLEPSESEARKKVPAELEASRWL